MPNWILNTLELSTPEDGKLICDAIKGETTLFDFNKVIPMPEGPDRVPHDASEDFYLYCFLNHAKTDEDKALARRVVEEHGDLDIVRKNADPASKTYAAVQEGHWKVCQNAHQSGETLKAGRIIATNIVNTGYPDWHAWRLGSWGCKWNASEVKVSNDCTTITYRTPWAAPYEVLIKLMEMFPTIPMHAHGYLEGVPSKKYDIEHDGSGKVMMLNPSIRF